MSVKPHAILGRLDNQLLCAIPLKPFGERVSNGCEILEMLTGVIRDVINLESYVGNELTSIAGKIHIPKTEIDTSVFDMLSSLQGELVNRANHSKQFVQALNMDLMAEKSLSVVAENHAAVYSKIKKQITTQELLSQTYLQEYREAVVDSVRADKVALHLVAKANSLARDSDKCKSFPQALQTISDAHAARERLRTASRCHNDFVNAFRGQKMCLMKVLIDLDAKRMTCLRDMITKLLVHQIAQLKNQEYDCQLCIKAIERTNVENDLVSVINGMIRSDNNPANNSTNNNPANTSIHNGSLDSNISVESQSNVETSFESALATEPPSTGRPAATTTVRQSPRLMAPPATTTVPPGPASFGRRSLAAATPHSLESSSSSGDKKEKEEEKEKPPTPSSSSPPAEASALSSPVPIPPPTMKNLPAKPPPPSSLAAAHDPPPAITIIPRERTTWSPTTSNQTVLSSSARADSSPYKLMDYDKLGALVEALISKQLYEELLPAFTIYELEYIENEVTERQPPRSNPLEGFLRGLIAGNAKRTEEQLQQSCVRQLKWTELRAQLVDALKAPVLPQSDDDEDSVNNKKLIQTFIAGLFDGDLDVVKKHLTPASVLMSRERFRHLSCAILLRAVDGQPRELKSRVFYAALCEMLNAMLDWTEGARDVISARTCVLVSSRISVLDDSSAQPNEWFPKGVMHTLGAEGSLKPSGSSLSRNLSKTLNRSFSSAAAALRSSHPNSSASRPESGSPDVINGAPSVAVGDSVDELCRVTDNLPPEKTFYLDSECVDDPDLLEPRSKGGERLMGGERDNEIADLAKSPVVWQLSRGIYDHKVWNRVVVWEEIIVYTLSENVQLNFLKSMFADDQTACTRVCNQFIISNPLTASLKSLPNYMLAFGINDVEVKGLIRKIRHRYGINSRQFANLA